jgi:hypothetical protein
MMDTLFLTIKIVPGRKTSKAVKAGHYAEVSQLITDKRFPICSYQASEREVCVISFGYDISPYLISGEIRGLHLIKPTYEDAFLVGEQHPEEQANGPIVFLHEPFVWSGYHFFIVLGKSDKGRTIHPVSCGDRWNSQFRFAFIKAR